MKNKFSYLQGMLLACLYGCSHVQVIKTGSHANIVLPPKDPSEISIFRTNKPDYKFEEIGAVSVKDIKDINIIYEKMRIEAGKRGADAVVDFKIDSEAKTVTSTSSSCTPQGGCHSVTSTSVVYAYTATGSLVHKLEEKK